MTYCRPYWTGSHVSVMDSLAEAERVCSEANDAIAVFVTAEIEMGLTLCRVANDHDEGDERTRFLRTAQRAYRTAEKVCTS
jgi:hypothetical protein